MIRESVMRCCRVDFFVFCDQHGETRYQTYEGSEQLYFALENKQIQVSRFYKNKCYKFTYTSGIWLLRTDEHLITFEDPRMRNLNFPNVDIYFFTEEEFRERQIIKIIT